MLLTHGNLRSKQNKSIQLSNLFCVKKLFLFTYIRGVYIYFYCDIFLPVYFSNFYFAEKILLLLPFSSNELYITSTFASQNKKTTVLEKFVLRLANAFNPRMKFSYIITLFMLNTNFNDVSFTPNF